MSPELRSIIRALIACSYSGGFDTAYPLNEILEDCRLPPDTVLYDENTETGLLWQLDHDGFIDVQDHGNGQYASVAMESLSCLEAWSREPMTNQAPSQKVRSFPWTETFDDDENSIWEAPSAFLDGEDGAPFMWRLKQRLANNRIEWYCASDPELVDGLSCDFWPNLGDAMTACENANDCIIHECSEGVGDEAL